MISRSLAPCARLRGHYRQSGVVAGVILEAAIGAISGGIVGAAGGFLFGLEIFTGGAGALLGGTMGAIGGAFNGLGGGFLSGLIYCGNPEYA
ncbi:MULTISPECIES: hypothetical protein [Arthrobacter]|uniref:hypothetical protein n=1 Tax=Arthrobacter TaxID=1663 RepID=UPI001057FC3B|nr:MULTISPECIES: hypothetical protein [Arthrobacter]